MNWIRQHRRNALLIGLTLAVPLYLYLQTLFGVLGLGIGYAGERGRIEPRVARLQGLIAREDELTQQSTLAETELRRLAFPSGQAPSALAARLQADVRQILQEGGLAVTNSQVMPLREGEVFDRVAVKATASGSLAALDAALIGIAAYEPRLVIEALDVFPAVGAGDAQQLTAVLELMILREVP